MISMTGYGYKEIESDDMNCSVEIKSYNNRYLDFSFNLPPFLGSVEQEIKALLSEKIKRGRIEISIRLRELNEDISIHVDDAVLKSYSDILARCSEVSGIESPVTLDTLIKMDGVLKTVKNRDIEKIWDIIRPVLNDAAAAFYESRAKEGQTTELDINRQLGVLENSYNKISTFADKIESKLKEDVTARFNQVLSGEVDEQRVLTEIASLLVKYSINEELSRLSGHIEAFKSILKKDAPVGKKLDFLCQEINREVNTIGSKSMILEVNQCVVDMKDALENIREQLRNVE